MSCYVYDIETLGTGENSVLLSMGCVYIPNVEPKSFEDLKSNSIFIKLDSKYQIETLKRTVDKSTIEWWMKQSKTVRDKSFKPTPDDVLPDKAFDMLRKFVFERTGQEKTVCYTRGFMDVILTSHLAKQVDSSTPWGYNQYRDVRTAIDIIYDFAKNGYVEVDSTRCFGYSEDKIDHHDPVSDCARDAAMMFYGKVS